ncbi:MAG: hypothetical protein AAGE59_31090 [Cyanobacteria bacterium P01_F01_bin.86]
MSPEQLQGIWVVAVISVAVTAFCPLLYYVLTVPVKGKLAAHSGRLQQCSLPQQA